MSDSFELYESLINKEIEKKIKACEQTNNVHQENLNSSTSGALISSYIKLVIENGLRHYKNPEDLTKQIDIANSIIDNIKQLVEDQEIEKFKIKEEKLLRGITSNLITEEEFSKVIPITSVAKTSLFTGNQHEPSVYSELKKEIATADRVDFLVSFIKFSGLRLIYDDLVEHTKTKKLRIITTSYMGATDYKAVQMLAQLPNTEIKISYDTTRTRLHAKAYYFHRESGFSTAYIGSSNMSRAALSEGTEWNLKLSEYNSAEIIEKYRKTFETYWNMHEFTSFDLYNEYDRNRLQESLSNETYTLSPDTPNYYFDIRPFAYQQEILDRLEIEREVHNSYKNLVVSATGTGKTIISAFDFKQFKAEHPGCKLLFLAHRKEILEQSISAFRGLLHDQNFGELWVEKHTPQKYNNVFASIQTMNSRNNYEMFSPEHFDYIVLDETHHSAAESYQRIITHFKPKILLGLTATPERMDGINILEYFNDRIAYEIRLKQAIESNLLCPFHYFAVSDNVDLRNAIWHRGRYDISLLDTKYIGNIQRDNAIFTAINKYLDNISKVKGLGFCTSRAHAKYMAKVFNERGIPSISLDSNSDVNQRNSAKDDIISGKIKFIFVVDLYNEGVDIPQVNTVLFLRPTESATIFIQQLGRGLRLHEGKEVLTVLDFIGQAHVQYDFGTKFHSMIGKTSHTLSEELHNDFPSIPRNCHIHMEKLAKEYVLRNIENTYLNVNKIRNIYANFKLNSTLEHNLQNFLKYSNIKPQDLYKSITFTQLASESEAIYAVSEISSLKAAMMKVSKINSVELIRFMITYLDNPKELESERDIRLALMFYYTIYNTNPSKSISDVFYELKMEYSEFVDEIIQLLKFSLNQVNHKPKLLEMGETIPLELHASYSTSQVLAALGINTTSRKEPFREGVKFVEKLNTDVFFITLNKSKKLFTETTMYEDYAIDQQHFHWQSQSRTSINSPTGQRYVNMRTNGSKVLIFVRENKTDSYGITETFTFLGKAMYLSHKGSSPISIVYKLNEKMPIEILKISNEVVDII